MLGLGSVAAPAPGLSQYPSQDLGDTSVQALDGHKVQLGVEFPQLVVVYRRCSAAFARKRGSRAGLWRMDQGQRKFPEGGSRAEACGQTACWSVRLKASPHWDQSGRRMCKGPREAGLRATCQIAKGPEVWKTELQPHPFSLSMVAICPWLEGDASTGDTMSTGHEEEAQKGG